jgi:hypothetical protein
MQGSTQRRVGRVGLFVLLLLSMILVAPATAANQTSDVASTQGFRRAVTLAGIREHQAALHQR